MKVLIISAYDNTNDNATSITINRILKPLKISDKAYIICTTAKQYANTQNKYYLDNTNIYGNSFVCKIKELLHNNKTNIKNTNITHTHYRSNLFSIFDIVNYKINSNLNEFISLHKPEVIYSPLGSLRIIELCLTISKKYKIPIIPHFMDDWPSTLYTYNFSSIIQKFKLNYLLCEVFKKNKTIFTISDYMSKIYEMKYRVNCVSIMNAITIDMDQKQDSNFYLKEDIYTFCYYGGLHLNRWKSLLFLCNEIDSMLNKIKIKINIYTNKEDWDKLSSVFSKFHFINYIGYYNADMAYSLLKKEDILIHLESFDTKVSLYTKLSISTKIPEYLSLKKPIIAIGPRNIASIEYLKTNNCAIIIDEIHKTNFLEMISLLKNKNYLEMISNNAYNLYLTHHTSEINNKKLIESLVKITNK